MALLVDHVTKSGARAHRSASEAIRSPLSLPQTSALQTGPRTRTMVVGATLPGLILTCLNLPL